MAKFPVVVSSEEDIAGTYIKGKITSQGTWTKVEQDCGAKELLFSEHYQAYLMTIEEALVQSDNMDAYCSRASIDPLAYVYASRHRSETARPALLAHVTGNWGDLAELGGEPRTVCIASGALLRLAFRALLRQKELHPEELAKFVVDLEVTHHGPTNLQTPLVFVELGSDETNWQDNAGAAAVASVIEELLDAIGKSNNDLAVLGHDLAGVGIGFGGLHYAQSFERVMADSAAALTHIIPKHAVKFMTREIIDLAVHNTFEPVSWFVLDWKGLNADDKAVLLPILETFPSIPIKRTKDLERDFSTTKA
jgi:D-aminoacyl-tRNA deacylase